MTKLKEFAKRETVLTVAWGLALGSMVLVPPDKHDWTCIDFHTLGLLFSLMVVMAGLQGLGLFRRLGEVMLGHTATTRQLEGVLIFLPFFTGMAVTNDVALITFVPFALEVLRLAGQEARLIPVVSMQTIAANLGSMTTPIGNPQNLYLYSHYQLGLRDFFRTMLPLTLGAALLLLLFLALEQSVPLAPTWRDRSETLLTDRNRLRLYGVLFAACLCAVANGLPVWLLCLLVLASVAAADRTILFRVDYSLLFTFVGFFLFVGNLGRLPAFSDLFQAALSGHETGCAILISQIISNVPAALLLSGFTQNWKALLVGTNLGGLGTLIASMASLISYKYVARSDSSLRGRYL
ncbi:MAG: SLC13 family permease, partial [Lawsonibacter sp.]|nr:SLC13 family permease [Lawsonibacter sp.]